MNMELGPTSPIVNIIGVSEDLSQPRPTPFVHTPVGSNHGLSSGDSLASEIGRLKLSSSRSDLGGGRFSPYTISARKIHSSHPPMSNKQRKARMWHAALQHKRHAAKMMLAAQKVIEEVEEEIGQCIPKAMLDKLHAKYYNADRSDDATAEAYIASVSAVRVDSQLGASGSASESGGRNSE